MSCFQDLVNLYEQATAPNPISYGRVIYPKHGLENEEEGEEGMGGIKKELLDKIIENPYRAQELAVRYVLNNRPVPLALLKSVITKAVLAVELADHYISIGKKMPLPKILQNRVRFLPTRDTKKLEDLEVERPDGEIDHWEIYRKPYIFLVGSSSNVGLLPTFYYEPPEGETEEQSLKEIGDDLEVLAKDGLSGMTHLKRVSKHPDAGYLSGKKYEYQS